MLAQQTGQQPPPELQAVLTLPSWDELKAVMMDDIQRNYRIDIETNSTVDAEATEDKQNMGEFLNAVAQFMNGIGPLVQEGIMPFEAAKAILLAVTRRYRFGPEVEDELSQMKPPQPQGPQDKPDPVAEAAAQKAHTEAKTAQAEAAHRMEQLQLEGNLSKAENAFKLQELQRKGELALATHGANLKKLELQLRSAEMAAKSAGIKKD
jgi:hypothetical protein